MWESRSVDLKIRLPREVAEQAEEIQASDPEFLSRLVLYGLTRRTVYEHLRTLGPERRNDRSDSSTVV